MNWMGLVQLSVPFHEKMEEFMPIPMSEKLVVWMVFRYLSHTLSIFFIIIFVNGQLESKKGCDIKANKFDSNSTLRL